MKFKLLKAALFIVVASAFAAYTDGRVGAQEKEKEKAKSTEVRRAPEPASEGPEWTLAIPMPAIAPIVMPDINLDMSNINIDMSDLNIDMGGDWFYEDDSERTEREELRQTYQLSANARVELSNIDGSIEIETHEGNAAELHITSYSRDPNPRKLSVEQTASGLSVRGEARRTREAGDGIDFDSTNYRVRLKLPRRVGLTVNGASGNVRVGEIDGAIRLSNVSGSVGVAQASGSAEVSQVSGSVTLNLARLGAGGVRVQNVSGKVALRFMDAVNANLQTSGIKGKVYVELANVAVEGEMNRADFRAKVGTGGAPINISDVTGSVRLARGRTVTEMLGALKGGERSASRMETARDLTLHVSNRQVRQAMIEALNGEQNGNVNPLGLYDLDRNIRAVGKAYKQLIQDWREVLPASSVCLAVPLVPPSQADRAYALAQQLGAAHANQQPPSEPANPEVG